MMIVEGIGLGFKSINLNNKSLNFSMDLMFEVTLLRKISPPEMRN
jgi:hypothetical protein